MLNGKFVIDGVVHAFDLSEDNYAFPHHAAPIALMYPEISKLQPDGYVLSPEAVLRNWDMSDTAALLFHESETDVAIYHPTPIFAFKDGMSSVEKGVSALERWPNR